MKSYKIPKNLKKKVKIETNLQNLREEKNPHKVKKIQNNQIQLKFNEKSNLKSVMGFNLVSAS